MTAAPQISAPTPGHFYRRYVRGGVKVPVRIWIEPGDRCPETDELLSDDVIRCEVAGEPADPMIEWVFCCDRPITKAEHDYLLAVMRHAERHDPSAPEATPRAPIDLNAIRPIF